MALEQSNNTDVTATSQEVAPQTEQPSFDYVPMVIAGVVLVVVLIAIAGAGV